MINATYSLQVGEKGADRLNILNKLYNPASQAFLLNNHLDAAKTILDVGCGTGIMTCWMAQASPHSKVIAVDTSEEQLAITKARADKLRLKNIEYHKLSIYELNQLNMQFDFAYCRWVLVHLLDAYEGLKSMYSVVKPGGILACEDIDLGSFFSYPKSPTLNRFIAAHLELFSAEHKNPHMANDLVFYFKRLGTENNNAAISQPILSNTQEKLIQCMALEELKEALLARNILSEYSFDKLLTDMQIFCRQEEIFDVHAYNILYCGIKPNLQTTVNSTSL